VLVQYPRNLGQNNLSSRKDTGTYHALAAMHMAHGGARRKRGYGPGSSTDEVARYPRHFCAHAVVLDAVAQLGKAQPRLDGASAGLLTNRVTHQLPQIG
jgi:hypothetical protein